MTFTLCHAAGDMFMGNARRDAVIDFAANHGDVFTVSESQKDHADIKAHAAMATYSVGELGIGWRKGTFVRAGMGHRQVMRGGRLGVLRAAGRVVPKRLRRARRGPSRLVAWVCLTEVATGQQVIVSTHHAIAKADTTHKWRRPLRRKGFLGVVAELKVAQARFPDADVILTGDMNARGRIYAFASAGLRQVNTPSTFGRLRYDRIFIKHGHVTGVRRAKTAGDHKALIATVTLGV